MRSPRKCGISCCIVCVISTMRQFISILYDSSELFREDTLIRLREIYKEVAEHEKSYKNSD
jgi:hypothetical protein